MNSATSNEFSLLLTLAVNAVVFWGAWRFVRRWGGDRIDCATDAMLVWYLVQYGVVAGLGIVGGLSGGMILVGGGVIGGGLIALGGNGGQARRLNEEGNDRRIFWGIGIGLIAYLLAIVWVSRYAPAAANDALAYHLPAAVQWLQTGKLGLFHTWFYNPANSYSPLAGSTFIAWLMGPMGNDSLARFVETPADVFLFFGIVTWARGIGTTVRTAVVLGFAVAVARPFISQTTLAKDDVPLAGMLVCAMGSLSRKRLKGPLGAWRVGAALGLFFAVKYTAMLSLPIIVLAIDAPWRAGWRMGRHAIAAGVALVIAGPWYVRNWILTGNPIYPTGVSVLGRSVFRGGLQMLHSDRLTSVRGAWETIVKSYYSPPPALAIAVALVWVAALICSWRKLMRWPLVRASLLGPPIVIAMFVLKSPYGEVRLIGPSFAMLLPAAALIPKQQLAVMIAIALAGLSLFTGFEFARLSVLLPYFAAFSVALITIGLAWIYLKRRPRLIAFSLAGAGFAMWTFMVWPSYLEQCNALAVLYWQQPFLYGNYADAWGVIRDQTPSGSTIAYDNFFMVYPLFGADLSRHVVFIPSKPGVHEVTDLPFMGPVIGEQVPVEVVRVMNEHADKLTWLINLVLSHARYVLVGKQDLTLSSRRVHPPELDYIASLPTHFRTLLSNDSVDVYEVVPGSHP